MQNLMELALFDDLFVRGNAEENSLSLTDVMNIGNSIRERKGLPIRDLYEFYLLNDTKEYIIALYKSDSKEGLISNTGISGDLENLDMIDVARKHYIKTKRGNNGGTWGNVYIAIKLATWLDKDFEVYLHKILVKQGIFKYRLLGKEKFKEMNLSIKENISDCTDTYKNVAVAINERCNGTYIDGWNHLSADANIQELRFKLMSDISMLVEKKFINSEIKLIEFIKNY